MSLEFLEAPKVDDVQRVPGESYKIVADLLERQDQVLDDLNSLNERIAAAIREMLPPVEEDEQASDPAGEPLSDKIAA